MKREYLTTEQGQLLLEQMGLEAFLMFTIQELNDYITQYEIAGITNAAALLIQSECQSNEKLSAKLKINPFIDQIMVEEAEGTDYDQGIIFFNVTADVGKKKPRQLGTAIAIDYYNCVQTIVENEMLEEDQALTADDVVQPESVQEVPEATVEEEILEPELELTNEEQPKFIEEVVPEKISEEAALAAEQEALDAARQAQQQLAAQQEQLRQQRIAYEQQLAAQQEQIRQQQMLQQQEFQRQQMMMQQQMLQQQEEFERQQMYQANMNYNAPIEIPKDVNYAEIYEDEIASDEPEKNVEYYDDHNKFLNKVYYAKSHGYEGKREYEFYEKKDEAPVEFKRIDYNREFNELGMPMGPVDIQIEDIDQIGNSGYVPYPFGPLKRPPVPYDLWRLIKDKKNLK